MYRLKPIRVRRKPKPPPQLVKAVHAAFWLTLFAAAALGGAQAIAGFPVLLVTILPPGIVAAQASDTSLEPYALLRITPPLEPSRYAPQVLYPIEHHEFPDWLLAARAPQADATTAPASETAAPVANPRVAIVIDDLGGDLAGTRRAMALPSPVTLSFLPFSDATTWLAPESARAGHEVLVHMPMEAEGDRDSGPFELSAALPPAEIRRRLEAALARVPDATGINNHRGSRFTADRAALIPVAEALSARHLFFFDSRTSAATQVVPVAHAFGVASAGRDVFLDDEQTANAVGAQIMELEAKARATGIAIAIGHPHDVTLSALAAWTANAAHHGFTLIPLSEAIRLKTERDARIALQ